MIWKRMSSTEAIKAVSTLEKKSSDEFYAIVEEWKNGKFSDSVDVEYREIREKIFGEYERYKNKSGYEIDLRVGLALYELFLTDEYKLNPIYANDDDIWRYLSVKVFLDVTYLREPSSDRFGVYFSHDRVYKHTKRIWIKQLWWWIHLAWQGDVDSTYEVLKKYGSGRISQVLERAGKGYRIDVTRKLLKKMSERTTQSKVSQDDFRALMMLYYAKMFVVEPTLVDGGIDSFLDKILDAKMPRSESDGVV